MEICTTENELSPRLESMTLSKLLQNVVVTKMYQTLYGQMVVTHDVQIDRIQYDSRKVTPNALFVAIRGAGFDGHNFISQAAGFGAKVIVVENDTTVPDSFFMHSGIVKVVVPDSRIALAQLSANYFDHPADKLVAIGVTGTNGKTTTTHLIKSILEANGSRTGLIGTIEYKIGTETVVATHTTPESLELNELLKKMVDQRCSAAVLEISSHALHQHRVDGIHFEAGVFTNLTQDHLDYHGSMEEYGLAKQILFEQLAPDSTAVVNIDDPWGERMLQLTRAKMISYAINIEADVRGKDILITMTGTTFTVVNANNETKITSSLIGKFNVSNILAAFATGVALGVPTPLIQQAIRETTSVRGRFEQITAPQGWTAIIDYAHTPDALLKALSAVQDIFHERGRGKIITVFGCGGNRDRAKRPRMGAIATEQSDLTIITSDNPRHEDPEKIIDDVMKGVKRNAEVIREADRKKAISTALSGASRNDVVLIAGKGHEEYQVVGDIKLHFSDREVVEEFILSHA